MSKKLSPSQRRQIISDYKNGIQNEEYRVIDRGNGDYQVRKRDSKFKLTKPKKEEVVEEEEVNRRTKCLVDSCLLWNRRWYLPVSYTKIFGTITFIPNTDTLFPPNRWTFYVRCRQWT